MKMSKLAMVSLAFAALSACSEGVSQEIVDQNQVISRDNGALNARGYVATLGEEAAKITIHPESDSTIDKDCRYGDGFATVNLKRDGQPFRKLQCQTTGSGLGINGCLEQGVFMSKKYGRVKDQCNSDITSMKKLGR